MAKSSKLSASSLKLLIDDRYKFVNKFLLWFDLEDPNIHFIIWKCLHRIAEHYNNTWIIDKDEWFKLLIESNELEWLTEEEKLETIQTIDNTFENMQWHIMKWWEAEKKIEDDNYVWYIDLFKDNCIFDYKFVKNFQSKWIFDPMKWYIIQMALYAYIMSTQNIDVDKCIVVEIKKWNTLIEEVWYLKKDYIIDCIRKENPLLEINTKLTREKLLEEYSPREPWCKKIIFDVNKRFLILWKFIYDSWIIVLDDIKRYMVSELQEEKTWINNNIKFVCRKMQEFIGLYYDKFMNNDNTI